MALADIMEAKHNIVASSGIPKSSRVKRTLERPY